MTRQPIPDFANGETFKPGLLGWTRLSARVLLLFLALLVCVPGHYLFRLFRLPSPWVKWFLGAAARICGARVKRRGAYLKRDVFFISNHLSWVDILVIGGTAGSAFVAKAELKDAPIVGWLAGLNRTLYVKREDRMQVAEQINRLRDALAENWTICVFPEGTTSNGLDLLPFKSPLMKVLEPPPPGIMVQPLFLEYGPVGPEIAWAIEAGLPNAIRILSRKGSFPVQVDFLEPFDPHEFANRKAIAAEARSRIEILHDAGLEKRRAL